MNDTNTYTVKLNAEQLLKLSELVMVALNSPGVDEFKYTDVFFLVMNQKDKYYDNNGIGD